MARLRLQLAHLVLRQHREACLGGVDQDGGEEGDGGREGEFPVGGPSLRRLPLSPQGSPLDQLAFKVQWSLWEVEGEF